MFNIVDKYNIQLSNYISTLFLIYKAILLIAENHNVKQKLKY